VLPWFFSETMYAAVRGTSNKHGSVCWGGITIYEDENNIRRDSKKGFFLLSFRNSRKKNQLNVFSSSCHLQKTHRWR